MPQKQKSASVFFGNEKIKLLGLIAALFSFLIYANAIFNDYNVDDELITDNHLLASGKTPTLKQIFTEPYYKDNSGNAYEYRPVVLLTFLAEFSIFGKSPQVSHAVNVILYSATCALLFFFLLSLFKDYAHRIEFSFLVTILFAAHPLHTEAVASIKNRDELLSLFFGLSAWMFALRVADRKSIPDYLLFLLFFVTGMFSKQTTITFSLLIPFSLMLFRRVSLPVMLAIAFPLALSSTLFSPVYLLYKKGLLFFGMFALLFVFYFLFARNETLIDKIVSFRKNMAARLSRALLLKTAVALFVVAGMAAGAYYLSVKNEKIADTLHDFNELQLTPALQTPAPTVIPITGRKLSYVEVPLLYAEKTSEKIGTSINALGIYLKLMFFPYPLRFYYGYNQVPLTGVDNLLTFASLAAYLIIIFLLLFLLVTRRHDIAAFGLLYYLISMIPLSNLITPLAGIIGERLVYPASLGFCIALVYALFYPKTAHASSVFARAGLARSLPVVFWAVIVVFSIMTVARNEKWEDRQTLMRHDIAHLPHSSRAHHLLASNTAFKYMNLRHTEAGRHKLREAEKHFLKAIAIYPEFPYAWYDLAKVYVMLDEREKALDSYYKCTKVNPEFVTCWFDLGVILEQNGKNSEAEQAYRKAIEADSLFLNPYTNLSYLLYRQERLNESLQVNLLATKRLPNAYEPYVNAGRTYLRLQDTANALVYMEKSFQLNPNDRSIVPVMADLFESIGNTEKANYYRSLKN